MTGMSGFRKVSNEGTGSPLMARMFVGMCALRDDLLLSSVAPLERDAVKEQFDKGLYPLFRSAQATRDAAVEVLSALSGHLEAVRNGTAASVSESQFNIDETIIESLPQSVDKLLTQAIVTTQSRLQRLLREPLGLDIGFLFGKDSPFAKGLERLESAGEAELASYLATVRRVWHEPIQELRRKVVHEGWNLPRLEYRITETRTVDVVLPVIAGLRLDEFVIATANRVLLFAEEMLVYAMQKLRKPPLGVGEIPLEQRDPANLKRFRVIVVPKSSTYHWPLMYGEGRDFV